MTRHEPVTPDVQYDKRHMQEFAVVLSLYMSKLFISLSAPIFYPVDAFHCSYRLVQNSKKFFLEEWGNWSDSDTMKESPFPATIASFCFMFEDKNPTPPCRRT